MNAEKIKTKKDRYLLPDTVRGLLVIAMAVYHLLFDLCYMFHVNMPWFRGEGMRLFQVLILTGFVSLSGFCFAWGKNKLRRSIEILICGFVIEIVTAVFMPSQKIVFGVLTCLGLCMLLMIALEKVLLKIPPVFGAVFFFALGLLTYGVRLGYIGIYTYPLFDLPDVLYSTSFLFPIGFKNAAFSSADYVPLLPWLFVYISGFFTSVAMGKSDRAKRVLRYGFRPAAAIGRYSLWIYMAHQPVLYAILWLVFKIPGLA